MSDYMFMLESHLSAEQSLAMSHTQAAAAHAGISIFLTGGALRDMLAGFPIRNLDFTVEGNGVSLAKRVGAETGAEVIHVDETRKAATLRFPGGTMITISMAVQAKYPEPAKPVLTPATIYEDLKSRDFTINAIAISLNAASRGLLMDPNNGVGDIERREIRTVNNYSLYDDPIRLLRLLRFRVRLGFSIADRTTAQYENARDAGLEAQIPTGALLEELISIANEQNSCEVLRVLHEEKLLGLFSPELVGAKANLAGLAKLQKAKQMVPYGIDLHVDEFSIVLSTLTEKLTAAERSRMASHLGMDKGLADRWLKLESRAKTLEEEVKAPKLHKPSAIYKTLAKAPGEEVLFLFLRSQERMVLDRTRNYLQKYLEMAHEVTDEDVVATGVELGSPKFEKAKADLISSHLDTKPKKVVPMVAVVQHEDETESVFAPED